MILKVHFKNSSLFVFCFLFFVFLPFLEFSIRITDLYRPDICNIIPCRVGLLRTHRMSISKVWKVWTICSSTFNWLIIIGSPLLTDDIASARNSTVLTRSWRDFFLGDSIEYYTRYLNESSIFWILDFFLPEVLDYFKINWILTWISYTIYNILC